ncbi:hypothetical protein [Paraburkholderia aromaticivorans]|nr:hypothetical protein [Paraburkholderia aromaticivorans]
MNGTDLADAVLSSTLKLPQREPTDDVPQAIRGLIHEPDSRNRLPGIAR